MATGTWDEKNRPTIPGWYNRFKNNAAAPRTPPESPCFAFLIG